MPDILIRGVEFPTMEQAYKTLIVSYDGKVYEGVHPQPTAKKKEPIAEAVELPPHGDLISRDDLLHTMRCHLALYDSCPEDLSLADKSRRDEIQNAIADIFNAPVVVPAERREE